MWIWSNTDDTLSVISGGVLSALHSTSVNAEGDDLKVYTVRCIYM